ncbi:MAG TPA: replicative DNA helicase [Kiritimatiellia bacterium]|nr:replicative DNA helicase [Kiritimatiellia bacterium]
MASAATNSPGAPRKLEPRIPPHSEEAERGVLGSILVDPERVLDLTLEAGLTPESFYSPRNRNLYELLVGMGRDNHPIDLLTVSERAKTAKLLEAIGGGENLEQLALEVPTTAHAHHYVDLVRQKELFRNVIDRAREAIELCYGEEEEATAVLDKVEQSFYSISENQHTPTSSWPATVKATMQTIDKIISDRKGITGVPTGFVDIDQYTKGLQPGDMIILAARPSMGKTSLAMNIAENVCTGNVYDKIKRPVAVFSLEMSSEALAKRMLCCKARVPFHHLFDGYAGKRDWPKLIEAADALSHAPLFVDDTPGLEPSALRARARRLKRKHDVQLIVIDYLQMMNSSAHSREGRQRETAAISGAVKAMAKELKVPVVVLSQLSRAPETRDRLAKPKLSDLRDSGSIEQDADVVCLLRRPCKYPDDPETTDKSLAILDVAKHRNGPTGEIRLNFIDELTLFENRAKGTDGPSAAGEL